MTPEMLGITFNMEAMNGKKTMENDWKSEGFWEKTWHTSQPNMLQLLEDMAYEGNVLERLCHHTWQTDVLYRGSRSFPMNMEQSWQTEVKMTGSVLLELLIVHLDRIF